MSKIGTSSIATFAKCEQIDTLIVDDKLSDEYIAKLANYNIKVD
jgi:DeoR/GlpR family transcriptional regulator of sugar metabolism